MNSMSNSQIARLLKIGESTVRNRLKTLAVQALIFEKQNQSDRISGMLLTTGLKRSRIRSLVRVTSTRRLGDDRILSITTLFHR